MKIHLNFTDSPSNSINKTLSKAKTFDVTLREATELLSPNILVKGILTDFVHYNYAYIPDFARYYFINNIATVSHELVNLSLTVDVLMTYRTQIKNLTAIVERSENFNNSFLIDEKLPLYAYTYTVNKQFPNGFNSQPAYFITVKG